MITLFTIPKPFTGHIGLIQRNALDSWAALRPACQILLFGDEDGVEDEAQRIGALHIPNIARNEHGTPLMSDVFARAQQIAQTRLVALVNTDILLMPDFLGAASFLARSQRGFMMVGRRTDLDITARLDIRDPAAMPRLAAQARKDGTLYTVRGSDYFVFPRHALGVVPAFAVGRGAWDNWLMFEARRRWHALVDATSIVLAIHQNHDYRHVFQGGNTFFGPENEENLRLAGGQRTMFSLEEASHVLDRRNDALFLRFRPIRKRLHEYPLLYPPLAVPFHLVRQMRRGTSRT